MKTQMAAIAQSHSDRDDEGIAPSDLDANRRT
jgi:hypothetical protein